MNEVNNLFVTASRNKYRFASGKGQVTVDDLWDLPFSALDNVAVGLDEEIQKTGRKSFVAKRAPSTTEANNKLEIVKFVIETKQTEEEARKQKVAKTEQKAFLQNLLQRKQMEKLEGLSLEDIQKQIEALG